MTLRELGKVRRRDPEGYEFLEEALSERNRRLNKAMEGNR
jgi:hypothetical protein